MTNLIELVDKYLAEKNNLTMQWRQATILNKVAHVPNRQFAYQTN